MSGSKKILKTIVFAVIIVFLFSFFYFIVSSRKEKHAKQIARKQFLKDLAPPEKIELPGIILISHFNEGENIGNLGAFGAWDKAPNDYTQVCYDSFSPIVKAGNKGYSLRMDYDVDSENPAFNGVWFKINRLDLSNYKNLVVKIKGDALRGFTKHFKIEMKNGVGEKGIYYVTGIEDQWKEFIIPLNKFMGISSFKDIRELIFVFEDWRVSAKEGTIYVDDMYFTEGKVLGGPLSDIFKTSREMIEKPDISEMTDKEFLEFVQRKSFAYFWKETHPDTGLTKDKANNFKKDDFKVASIAAVGFGLTIYPIAIEKGWITKEEGLERTLTTLKFFRDKVENVHGFFYHFLGYSDGRRVWNCELSSIDTALLVAGMLFAGEYFGGEVKQIADEIYRNVEWDWMMAGGETVSMGWDEKKGFLTDHWNKYGEQMILYILGMGSPTYPLPVSVWEDLRRPLWEYDGITVLASPPLFTHQYSHMWVDFRNKHDNYADYFQSSINATLVNKKFCNDNKYNSNTFKNENSWGLTACESPAGYRAYGAPPGYASYDGTVAFTAPAASVAFTPEESISALRWMYENHKDYIWGKYGFVDSYNLGKKWYSDVVIGIDQGPIIIMIENYFNAFVWKYFMKNQYVKKSMKLAGFVPGSMPLEKEETPIIIARHKDGNENVGLYSMKPSKHLEYGSYTHYPQDLGIDYAVSWDENNLYVKADITDNEIIPAEKANELYKQDCLEIYVTPKNSLLYWGNPLHFQLGFSPKGIEGKPLKFAWFQEKDIEEIKVNSVITKTGYKLDIIIPFKVLNVKPEAGAEIGFSIALHDLDSKDDTKQCKYNLFFVPVYEEGSQKGFKLAVLKLGK